MLVTFSTGYRATRSLVRRRQFTVKPIIRSSHSRKVSEIVSILSGKVVGGRFLASHTVSCKQTMHETNGHVLLVMPLISRYIARSVIASLQLFHRVPLLEFLSLFQVDFGICFDIDGVITRGYLPFQESEEAFSKLQANDKFLYPVAFVTNGMSLHQRKADQLSSWVKAKVGVLSAIMC